MIVVPYSAAHFDGVDRLWKTVFPADPPRNSAALAVPAKLALDDGLFLIAQGEDGCVLGTIMAGYDGHRGWLYAVAVDPAAQRGGIGSALVREALAQLALLGCSKVNLQIREGNEAVAAFYQTLGFAIEPRTSMGRTI